MQIEKTRGNEIMMKAFAIERYGKKETGRILEMPVPEVGMQDVLVQIHAASLNPLDSKIRNGELKLLLPYRLPLILGNDLAGTVTKVGALVNKFKVGDKVYARPDDDRIGTFAEYIAVKESSLAHIPINLTMEEAAAVPLVGLTAWQTLIEAAQLKKGQKVLIHAGSGGVGTFAIQLAKYLGTIVATTTSAKNFELVKKLGADIVIDYKSEDFSTKLQGYDVVLDSLGGQTLVNSLKVLKPGGKLITLAGPPDPAFAKAIGANWLISLIMRLLSHKIRKLAKRKGVSYSFVFMKANGSQLQEITALIESGAIYPVIDRVFPFSSINDAFTYLDTGRAKGKLVIKVI